MRNEDNTLGCPVLLRQLGGRRENGCVKKKRIFVRTITDRDETARRPDGLRNPHMEIPFVTESFSPDGLFREQTGLPYPRAAETIPDST